VVATGGFCKLSTEKVLARVKLLTPYCPAVTAEVALMVQVLPPLEETIGPIELIPVKIKSTPG
jgi:hypothetical protein